MKSILTTFGRVGWFYTKEDHAKRFGLGWVTITFFDYDFEERVTMCMAVANIAKHYQNMPDMASLRKKR